MAKTTNSGDEMVWFHYPTPTPLSKILRSVALWSGHEFILDPDLDWLLQVTAPDKVSRDEAMVMLEETLTASGLRLVNVADNTFRVDQTSDPSSLEAS